MKKHLMTSAGRKYLIFVIVLLILVSLFFINVFRHNKPADYSNKNVKVNISTIDTFNYSKVVTVEDQIKLLEDRESKGNFDVSSKMTKAQYQKIFRTSVIVGDSITEGLTSYGFLSEDQVFSKIGASVLNSDDIINTAAKTYPGFAFFSFGMNDMGNFTGHAGAFIDKYKSVLAQFHKTSPGTNIYINAISIPAKSAISANHTLKHYKEFNAAIKQMCKDEGYTFIDNSYILEEHPEFYASDGIHVSPKYYPLWLNHMIMKAGL